ncbi:MAG: DUF2306 domain-containing protein [Pseudomonadota bacterium]
MNRTSTTTHAASHRNRNRSHPFVSRFWTLALVLSAGYIAAMASQYLWLAPIEYSFGAQIETYTANRLTMMLHIGAGVIALLAGTAQFIPLLKRFRLLHRVAGSVYCIAVGIGGTAGLRAATFAFGGASNSVAFGMMSTLWLLTTALALVNVYRGNLEAHQRWMKRSFAITLAAVTLRIELGLFIFVGGLSFSETYLIVPWTSWVGNLLILEWWPGLLRFRLPFGVNRLRHSHGDHPSVMTPSDV